MKQQELIQLNALGDAALKAADGSIGVGSELDPQAVIRYCLEHDFRHVIQRSRTDYEKEVEAAQRIGSSRNDYMSFPLSVILGAPDVGESSEKNLRTMNFEFNSAGQKREMLDAFATYLTTIPVRVHVAQAANQVADELFTNAAFGAPFVDAENLTSGASRSLPDAAKVAPSQSAQFFAGYDMERLVIGCRDQFGQLHPTKMLSRILDVYTHGIAGMIRQGNVGAGIGSFIVMNSSASLYIGVEKGKATVICSVIPMLGSERKRMETPKNLHYFTF